jgi:ketosteroid isomerase-like protein
MPHAAYTGAMPIKYVLARCGILALLVLISGCNWQASIDHRDLNEAVIRDLDAQWSKTAAAHDLNGIVSYYSDDAVLLPPNAPLANTKDAIRVAWVDLAAPNVDISWQASKIEVAKSGDLAYSTGSYTLAMQDPQGKLISDKGKFMEVWKKQTDGQWKAVADTYNSDLPVQP